MDGFGRRTMIIYGRWTKVYGRTDGPSISWTEKNDRPWLFCIEGRSCYDPKISKPCDRFLENKWSLILQFKVRIFLAKWSYSSKIQRSYILIDRILLVERLYTVSGILSAKCLQSTFVSNFIIMFLLYFFPSIRFKNRVKASKMSLKRFQNKLL